MSGKDMSGLALDLSNGRRVAAFPMPDGASFGFIFTNQGVETRVKLSREALQAMRDIVDEIDSKGLYVVAA